MDPDHPVGAIAAAIRQALPDFQDWPLDVGEAAARFFTGARGVSIATGCKPSCRPALQKGVPALSCVRRAVLLRLSENGRVQSVYELLRDSPDEQAFRDVKNDMRISDLLDSTWMIAGPLELRSVQDLLERLRSALLPREQLRFSPDDEPRYRSALQLHVDGRSGQFAHGGVLAEWPGRPSGFDAAHLRIFLEPWATVQSGHVVEFPQLPEMPFGITRDYRRSNDQ